MKNRLIAAALLGLVSCSRDPTVLVTVDTIPAAALSLQVIATHGGFAEAKEIEPYELPSPPPTSTTFLLRLPAGFSGDLGVHVAAYDQPGAKGCLLGTGSGATEMFMAPDDKLRVSLDAAADMDCTGSRPVLLSATPSIGKTTGGEEVTLRGWGFKPDASLTMGIKSASFMFKSASELIATTPVKAGFGLTNIRVANKDGSFASRKDLFRFYTDTLSFTTFPLNNSVPFNNLASFAVGVFDPTTTLDLAITLPTSNQVRIEYTVGGMVIDAKKKSFNVGSMPGPIATADFDKDGDLDILIANTGDRSLQLLKNDGTGNFLLGAPLVIGSNAAARPLALIAGDLNGDGAPDVVIADTVNGEVQVLLNMGDGTLIVDPTQILDVSNEPVSLALGDA